ncbi:MAG: hypothetical protein NTZ61_08865 [Proteobacteria bacterium]|nr:hypothetical protein [Pseudomonadota bacterium]
MHDPHDTRPQVRERAAALVALHDFDPVHGHCRTCGELPELAALSGCERMNHDSEPASRELLRSRGIERPELAATVAALVAARERRA